MSAALAAISAGTALWSAYQQSQANKGSSGTLEQSPANWKDVGVGGEEMWNQWISNFYGAEDPNLPTHSEVRKEIADLEKSKKDKVKYTTQHTGRDGITKTIEQFRPKTPEEIAEIDSDIQSLQTLIGHLDTIQESDEPSYQDKLEQDVSYQKTEAGKWDAAQDITDKLFTDTTGGITDAYTTELNNFSDKLTSAEKQYMQPLTLLKIAGQPISAIPKRNMMAMDQARGNVGTLANLAGSRYNAGLGQATNAYNVGTSGNTRDYTIASEFTPNKGYFTYMDKTWPMLTNMQGWRFGLPSQRFSLTYRPDFMETLGGAVQTGGNTYDWLNSIQQNQPPQATTAGYTTPYYGGYAQTTPQQSQSMNYPSQYNVGY